jgi:hypothetical protein
MENMSPAEWWGKIDEVAKENAAKGIKLPEVGPVPPSLPPSLFLPPSPPPSLPPSPAPHR